jgi:UDP-GlcNAc:undecaprenyl-phosphate GlcNAc-1-phosphate transferase
MEADAILAFLVALLAATGLTPVVARFARRVGAVDRVTERGLAREATPLLGGLAILAGVLVAAVIFLPLTDRTVGILAAAALITVVGLIDDVRDLPPGAKLCGQFAAATICVLAGVRVSNITLPLLGAIDLGDLGGPLTLLGLVFVMNVVNFSDGIDGLAAGVCAISAAAFSIIAFDLAKDTAGVLAAIVAGAALGFLAHNFHPASVFMGDAGSNLLGLLLGAVIVEGSLKTNALVALIVPLIVLAVPFLDTSFVVAKRIKYRRPVYRADSNHFHHRFHRIGFSQRRTVLYLYAWTLTMATVAVLLRYVPYSDNHGRLLLGGSLVMGACFLVAFAASVYLVYVLEIVKLRRLRAWQLRHMDPGTSEHEIDAEVERELETGEFTAVEGSAPPKSSPSAPPPPPPRAATAERRAAPS